MTVAAQVKQTIASLRGAQATLEAMASIEKNNISRDILSRSGQRLGEIIPDLEKRVGRIEFEEPQYKGF